VLSAASSSSNCQLLIACDCVYDTSHIGRSPLVPIIKDFVAASTARGGDNGTGRREPFAERFAILALETRDKEIESDFEFQLNEAGLRSVLAHEAPCPQPSEGNETPPEEARYRIFVITEGTLEPPAATEVDE
jgi:hypothetical protein